MNHKFHDIYSQDILIVDDTPDNLRLLTHMLTERGYKVRKALNGKIAISACETLLPDLILLDIMMPDMDGYEVCKQLKADERTRDVPVIFISALDDVWDKVTAFTVGGVDYITKPFKAVEVLARVENQLTIRQLQRQLIEQNAQLQQLNGELTKSNAELEQFAYVASHDLQSPLQVIIGYADLLNWKYEKQLDADGDRYLGELVDAAMRMTQLIQDLLTYSRIGVPTENFEPVDCNSVLEEAIANLSHQISSNSVAIGHPHLPIVLGNNTQLIQLFQNILSNSIKFRRPEVTPNIEILLNAQNEDEWLFTIRDNGIGIETKNFNRIFEVFQQLHSYKEYPGTGIGMTICKKIVERHGGYIWVESQVGLGTSVYFTLPTIK